MDSNQITLGDLAAMPRWVAWQTERNPEGRVTKVPKSPHGGNARSNDPTTWGTLAEAQKREAALDKPHGLGGIGIELGDLGNGMAIGGLDLDSCRDPATGAIEQWALDIAALFGSYVEVSPSGTGAKAFFTYDSAELPDLLKIMGTAGGKKWTPNGTGADHPPAIELYLTGRYFAVTHDKLDSSPADLRNVARDTIEHLIRHAGPAFKGDAPAAAPDPKPAAAPTDDWDGLLPRLEILARLSPEVAKLLAGDFTGLKDSSRSGKAMALGGAVKRAGWGYDDMAQVLRNWAETAEWCHEKGDGNRERELKRIWERAGTKPEAEPATAEFTADLAAPAPELPNAEWWLNRALERPEPLLGEVICGTSRVMVGGPTGIGKSHLGMGMAAALATGSDFAHWKCGRPIRVLYIDGEMARDLVKDRLADLKRRLGGADLSNLVMMSHEDFPALGPLNTPAGQVFLLKCVEEWKIEAVFFDNRMSLLNGDMKDEVPWTETMPLVRELTKRRVAQVWFDHTGHDGSKIYGSKTKEWQLDTVALLSADEQDGADIGFRIEFTKARRRRPETRSDFATTTLSLQNDVWVVGDGAATVRRRDLTASAKSALAVLVEMGGRADEKEWRRRCDDSKRVSASDKPDSRSKAMARAFADLIAAEAVKAAGGVVWVPKIGEEFTVNEPDRHGHLPDMSDMSAPGKAAEPDRQDTTPIGVSNVRSSQPEIKSKNINSLGTDNSRINAGDPSPVRPDPAIRDSLADLIGPPESEADGKRRRDRLKAAAAMVAAGWRPVAQGVVFPGGMEFRMDMDGGQSWGRMPPSIPDELDAMLQ
jgi:hypothetical protein